ncbi:MAG: M28 family peptidase [Rikenellaceae bacterium]|nr:M28 family peptidase [Rikenellaceae bacterium]
MKKLLVILLSVLAVHVGAQDLKHYKKVVKELSSAKYQGRGYALHGANKAGAYLEKEFLRAGADEVVRQPFTLNVNTFPGKMEMKVDGRRMQPGVDFTVREFSPGIEGTFKLYYIDTLNYNSEKIFADLASPEYQGAFVVCDFWFSYKHGADFRRLQDDKKYSNSGIIFTWNEPLKFYKAYADRLINKPVLWATNFPSNADVVSLNIENLYLEKYECFNVIAKVEGARHDSCFVFTAHYDHLGNLGRKVYYAGAHDNASGTAAIVTLAAYYAQNRPEYDIYFIAFSGEDAYLRGSEWFAANPTVELGKIRYLLNLDMIGDNNPVQYCEVSNQGERGYKLFEKINAQNSYFKKLNRGKLVGNSDHYPFAQRCVPCIFLENEGGDAFKYYHTTLDTWERALFDSYEPLFKMVTDFVEQY